MSTTRRSPIATQLTAALLFFAFPLLGLAYLLWDLPGLVLGGGMGGLGLLSLLLFQRAERPEPGSQILRQEVASLEAALEEERQAYLGSETLLRQREEEGIQLEERCAQLEAFAEERGRHSQLLEREVEQLKGEIRRLLHLEPEVEQELPPPAEMEEEQWTQTLPHSSKLEVANQYDAHALLVQCLDRAQSLGGVRALAGRSRRFEELSMGDYAIDLRQLFDTFRSERGAVVALHSPKEERLLFASNLIRGLLGWGPERFVRDFSWLVRKGVEEWREWVGALALGETGHVEMVFRSASDEEVPVGCALGRIPSGAFQGLVIAILYRL